MSKPEEITRLAESLIGSPYVYGTWGQTCTPALRKRYASYRPEQKEITYKRCPVLSEKQKSCDGCKFQGKLAFDCRGFTHYCLEKSWISIEGGSVGNQWNNKSNWAEKGDIAAMPDLVCCVFIKKAGGSWSHTGLHVGGGRIIHCSVEVKEEQLGTARSWTHYAIPTGLYTSEEIKEAHKGGFTRMLKKGMQGEDVRDLQQMLADAGFSCGKIDGIFGNNTEAAVKAFQAMNALKADGIAGPQTLQLLTERTKDPDQPELPEDADDHHDPFCVLLTYDEATKLRDALKTALALVEAALK